ncbi:hypothetical protein [Serratia sp. 2723]|uniref:hypothetical protein n=1 Tax=unclassified Serratia (in: enterobacteria) TaxID=2647522 RepID=UPI003D1E2875
MNTLNVKKALQCLKQAPAARVALCLVLGGGQVSLQAADSNTLNMTGKVTATACTIKLTPQGAITLPSTSAGEIWKKTVKVQNELTKVTLTLENCGLGTSNVTPTLKFDGTLADNGDFTANASSLGYRFRNKGAAGGTAKEFFIAVLKKNPLTAWDSSNAYQTTDPLVLTTPALGKGDSGMNTSSTFWLGVAAGSSSQTKPANARAGTVIADIKVKLEYK